MRAVSGGGECGRQLVPGNQHERRHDSLSVHNNFLDRLVEYEVALLVHTHKLAHQHPPVRYLDLQS